jgi:SAM-dependent methyltransferase
VSDDTSREVLRLFDGKAAGWSGKYGDAGPLAHRLDLFETALRAATPPPGDVLELGCGTGELAARLSRAGYRVTACDIAPNMLARARQNFAPLPVRWEQLAPDSPALPAADGSLDAVISSSVFEYLDNPEASLREAARALRPGGVALISVPDPTHTVRRLERLARPAARRLRTLPWPRRAASYLTYLTVSKNHFHGAHWEAMGCRVGFESLPVAAAPPPTMQLLLFRRSR